MDRMIHTALSAMQGAMARQAATAHNVANASTPGFRAQLLESATLRLDARGQAPRSMAQLTGVGTDMASAPVTQTDRPLDIALDGAALLAVQGRDGEEAYTRRGDLSVDANGILVTGAGDVVLGEAGPISAPRNAVLQVAPDGRIRAQTAGSEELTDIGRIKLVSPIGSTIERGEDGLLRVPDGGILPADPTATLQSGRLEGSNIDTATALTAMIEASRSWDAQLQVMTTARDLDSAGAELMRMPA